MNRLTWIPALALLLVMATGDHARAGDSLYDARNAMVGIVLGVQLGHASGNRTIVGVEGGVGLGPERLNLGFEHRAGTSFSYVELDPWLLVGATIGVGVDGDGVAHPVGGVWEGLPLDSIDCGDGFGPMMSVSLGYRFTGAHELYVSLKAGIAHRFCYLGRT